MHFFTTIFLSGLALQARLSFAKEDEKPDVPCTVHSPKTGSFYDLRELALHPPENPEKLKKGERAESWRSTGYDYGTNFTLNICAPVIEKLDNVVGIDEKLYRNISAYYTQNGKTYSIGSQSSEVIFRGRKLVLQYINGSPCGSSGSKADSHGIDAIKDTKYDYDKKTKPETKDAAKHKKSTTISFHCEKDPLATQAVASFVGTDPDECAYFFEVRSTAACGGAEPIEAGQGLGPGGVFGVILVIAVLVYFIGGVMYQRSVAHARGWKQLPNYSMWAGIGTFFRDMFIILTSSCARFLPSRRGYTSVSNGYGDSRSSRGRPEDENRLIDQLDEEWDD